MAFLKAFAGKRVLVTGHTGFKGSWLSEWLLALGADVHGLALPPPTEPALFDKLGLGSRMHHHLGDVRDAGLVQSLVATIAPDFVFHLAAQPLVRLSYQQPVETFDTNIMGTVHVLDALRQAQRRCTVIAVTTDKCYHNQEWVHSYRETDPLGGYDPYSSSKGAAEIVIAAYRNSFFSSPDSPIRLASARAGNVIGGGDWALDRIFPDCIRALESGDRIPVRNKTATRPWQHVLEPLAGYLWLAACLDRETPDGPLSSAFNFGPPLDSNRTVADLVVEILKHWPGQWEDLSDPKAVHEAKLLNLATDKAFHHLGWRPVWSFEETIARTVHWYQNARSARSVTPDQIASYHARAAELRIPWAL
jgi:CDP-glucose 4,6-dehydratase